MTNRYRQVGAYGKFQYRTNSSEEIEIVYFRSKGTLTKRLDVMRAAVEKMCENSLKLLS